MKPINILTGLLVVVFFASCEKNIEFSGETVEPKLVINSFVTPDSVLTANITESRFFLDDNEYRQKYTTVENAEVLVYVNDVYKEKMAHVSNGNYKAGFAPNIGETIRLEVSTPELKTAWCETKIENAVQIISIDTTVKILATTPILNGLYTSEGSGNTDTIGYSSSLEYNFSLHFKDQESGQNYYRLLVKRVLLFNEIPTESNYFEFTDIVSGENKDSETGISNENSYPNTYHVFSDELFNGKEYSLKFKTSSMHFKYFPDAPYKNEPTEEKVMVELQSISKSYYLYLKTRAASASVDGDYFTEPIQIHSNVHNGIGIIGSHSSSGVREIKLSF